MKRRKALEKEKQWRRTEIQIQGTKERRIGWKRERHQRPFGRED